MLIIKGKCECTWNSLKFSNFRRIAAASGKCRVRYTKRGNIEIFWNTLKSKFFGILKKLSFEGLPWICKTFPNWFAIRANFYPLERRRLLPVNLQKSANKFSLLYSKIKRAWQSLRVNQTSILLNALARQVNESRGQCVLSAYVRQTYDYMKDRSRSHFVAAQTT